MVEPAQLPLELRDIVFEYYIAGYHADLIPQKHILDETQRHQTQTRLLEKMEALCCLSRRTAQLAKPACERAVDDARRRFHATDPNPDYWILTDQLYILNAMRDRSMRFVKPGRFCWKLQPTDLDLFSDVHYCHLYVCDLLIAGQRKETKAMQYSRNLWWLAARKSITDIRSGNSEAA